MTIERVNTDTPLMEKDEPPSCTLLGCSRGDTALNFRDMSEAWMEILQKGRVFRSSELYSPEHVQKNGIKAILDLRRMKGCCKKEQDTAPSTSNAGGCRVCEKDWNLLGVAQPKVYHVDLISKTLKLYIVAKMPCKMWWDVAKTVYHGDDPARIMCPAIADSNIFGFKWFYVAILEKSKDYIAKALRLFTDASSYPILLHCVHGKDRTGLIVMLLLSLCGVPDHAIVADYAESDRLLKKGKEENALQMSDYLQQDKVIAAIPGDIKGAIAHISEKYGSVVDYLFSAGLTEKEMQNIRVNLLVEGVIVDVPREQEKEAPKKDKAADKHTEDLHDELSLTFEDSAWEVPPFIPDEDGFSSCSNS